MAANNPHLPKKRASWRQGLGRSFMRGAEFPRRWARQHSWDSGSAGRGSLPGLLPGRRLLSASLREPAAPPGACGSPAQRLRAGLWTLTGDQPASGRLAAAEEAGPQGAAIRQPRSPGESAAGPPRFRVGQRPQPDGQAAAASRPARPLHKSLSVAGRGSREKALLVASQAYLE